MPERGDFDDVADPIRLRAEIARQRKVIRALIERAERPASGSERSDFAVFHSAVAFEQQLRQRTDDLRRALHDNERMTRSLRESEAMLRTIVQQPLVGIAIIDQGRFAFVNSKLGDLFGYSKDEIIAVDPLHLIVEDDHDLVAEQVRRRRDREVSSANYVFRGRRKDGVVIEVETYGTAIEFHGRLALLSVFLDVTERLRAERERASYYAELEDQSNRDWLTGLFNRRYFDAALARELALARETNGHLALALCDLDLFKRVNDRFGHEAGDRVLRAFAGDVARVRRPRDLACRVGGEEFAVVFPFTGLAAAVEQIAALRQTIARSSVMHGDVAIRYTFSCGIAAFPADGATVAHLFNRADAALYAAKCGGRNRTELAGKPDVSVAV